MFQEDGSSHVEWVACVCQTPLESERKHACHTLQEGARQYGIPTPQVVCPWRVEAM